MKKITVPTPNRSICNLMLVSLAVIMVTFVGVTQASAQSSPEGVYEAWVARYDSPENHNDEAYAIAVDGSGNVYVTGESYGNYATIKYDTDGNQLWVKVYDASGSHGDEAYAIAVDGSGNVYVTGKAWGSGYDYATIKYDTDGNQLWVKHYDGPAGNDVACAIALDTAGNVYVTGKSYGGGSTLTDYATIKYDTDGNQLWVKRYDGPASGNDHDEAYAIAVDDSGNVYVTGRRMSIGNYYDYATIKYDTDGNQLWVKHYDGPASNWDVANDIAIDGSGNVYVTGESWGSGYDYATIKYDTDGNQLWVKRYNGPANYFDKAYAIAVDGLGSVYVTGESWGSGTSTDYATIKYDTDGNQLWVKRYDSYSDSVYSYRDEAYAIAVDGSGNVYVTGRSKGFGSNNTDYATIKYDTDGNEFWVKRHDGPSSGFNMDEAYAIAVDGSGNVYVTGRSGGIRFDYATIKYAPYVLLFTPTTPCRIVDTRKAGGAITSGGVRSYNVYGTVASQGGNPAGCPSPKGEPYSVHINVTSVPLGNGWITAYPFGSAAPWASLVNYRSDAQNVANSGTVKTCFNCAKDISVKSGKGTTHVVIDVLGYYYAQP